MELAEFKGVISQRYQALRRCYPRFLCETALCNVLRFVLGYQAREEIPSELEVFEDDVIKLISDDKKIWKEQIKIILGFMGVGPEIEKSYQSQLKKRVKEPLFC
ncbi:hypothetical protein M0R01_02355 [bacterium]|nr:hypothetical protein [bacterium]